MAYEIEFNKLDKLRRSGRFVGKNYVRFEIVLTYITIKIWLN